MLPPTRALLAPFRVDRNEAMIFGFYFFENCPAVDFFSSARNKKPVGEVFGLFK